MSVSNGQVADQTTFNTSFISREVDSDTIGVVGLNNTTDITSGAAITNTQRAINKAFDTDGITDEIDVTAKTYSSNNVVSNGDDRKVAIGKLDDKFSDTAGSGGHPHDGTPGGGPQIDASNLDNINLYFADFQTTTFDSAGGIDDDVSTAFSGETPGGGTSAIGVVTTAPHNRCEIRTKDSGEQIEDAGGQKVYARITESAGVWTLTYYTNEAGVETSHSLSSQDIRIYFKEVFDQFTRPTFPSDVGDIGSLDMTADIVDASATQRGAVSTGTQSFAGAKTFTGDVIATAKLRGDVATDAATTGLNATLPAPSKAILRITNASLDSIDMISSPSASQMFVLINRTGGNVIVNDETGATASERIRTGTGAALTLADNASLFLQYDSTSSRWQVTGGSGGTDQVGFQESIGTGNGVTTSFGPLTQVPTSEDSIAVFVDGLIEDTANWSLSGSNIVFSTAPAADTNIYVFYLSQGTPTPPPAPSGTLRTEFRTLTGGEVTAKQLTLAYTPAVAGDVLVDIIGGSAQEYSVDYTVSSNVFDWNGYALDGLLSAGDKIRFHYIT